MNPDQTAAIEYAFGLLWLAATHDAKVIEARKRLGSALDFSARMRGVNAAMLFAGWEYKTVETGRKSGTGHKDVWPEGDGWEIDLTRGRPGEGWERFDCHEELYFRRPVSTEPSGGDHDA